MIELWENWQKNHIDARSDLALCEFGILKINEVILNRILQ